MIIGPRWAMLLSVVYVAFLGRAPCTNETLSNFCYIMGPSKGDTIVWYRVTRHPHVLCGLTIGQWILGFWGATLCLILVDSRIIISFISQLFQFIHLE